MKRLLPLVVVCAGLYAYHDSFGGPFLFDDFISIQNNASIRGLGTSLSPPRRTPVSHRPVVNLTFAVNYAIGGLGVGSYHAVNLVIHLLAALTLMGVVRRTLESPQLRRRYATDAPWLAAAVALLWVVHPLGSEAVTYVTQRSESLVSLFLLLTLYWAIRGFGSPQRLRWHGAALAASALAAGSKEIAVAAPVLVLVWDRLFWSGSWREALRRHRVLYGGLTIIALVLVAVTSGRVTGVMLGRGKRPVPPWDYLKTQCGAITHYLRLIVWPELCGDYYDWPITTSLRAALAPMLFLAVLGGLTLWALGRGLAAAFPAVVCFVILAPTSSLFPLGGELVAERRMYLPLAALIALAVVAGWTVCRRDPRLRLGGSVLVAVLAVGLAQATVRRNQVYRSHDAFWSDVMTKRPHNARARINLGDRRFREGRRREALAFYEEAVRLNPSDPDTHYGLGVVLASEGRLDEAIARYEETLRLSPTYARAHNNLGTILAARGRWDEAVAHYEAAIRFAPESVSAHYNVALALARLGRMEEAIRHLEMALRLDPQHAKAAQALADFRGRAVR